jgi:hypothetical protein
MADFSSTRYAVVLKKLTKELVLKWLAYVFKIDFVPKISTQKLWQGTN